MHNDPFTIMDFRWLFWTWKPSPRLSLFKIDTSLHNPKHIYISDVPKDLHILHDVQDIGWIEKELEKDGYWYWKSNLCNLWSKKYLAWQRKIEKAVAFFCC